MSPESVSPASLSVSVLTAWKRTGGFSGYGTRGGYVTVAVRGGVGEFVVASGGQIGPAFAECLRGDG
ncbi:MAG: hypothetical protein OXF02_00725 [Simkaniaceae bacterium]|nr:hypothetical protein [Simkaniaceae bacterium]